MRPALTEVCRRFGLGRPLGAGERLRGGFLHSVWRVRTESGEFAVKVLRPPAGVDRAAWLAAYPGSFPLERAALDAGLLVPRPVPAEDGAWLAAIEGHAVRVHEWLPGTTLRPEDVERGLARRAGGLLAAVHRLALPVLHDARAVLSTEPTRGWGSREAELPEARGMASVMAEVRPAIESGRAIAGRPVMGHRDLNPKNLLRLPDGRLALIDWELAGPVSARLDAAATALDWAGAFWWEPDPVLVRALLSGYTESGGDFPPDAGDGRLLAGWLEGIARFAETTYLRALHAGTETERRRARSNAAFMVRQLRRGLEARQRWAGLLAPEPA